ncbi:uncharacterized protein Z519_02901 [Cladophialophora bantiana CBS 173.52]|uniref:Uncharacterized protein n=1 Tax=Cladophialophora bantiana (strain ATCC 10958 / CBS 173.52 / CDC B-1940 / NIH 8579) TaxID=1442370 RepID=A0A0D2GB81_CLAB1|nr:uncharacterized protein Z519_02901 [Cladophialophora bantiana CBS 173.52]KIW95837.1 hypothetical protein Z519_02901 [Cladophialophora bantiana CBS 173.52]
MSLVGISPSDIVNGVHAAKTIIEAVRDDNGSEEKVLAASTGIHHHLESIKNFENALNSMPQESSASKTQVQSRVMSLRTIQEAQKSRLAKYKDPLINRTGCKAKVKRVYRQLAWPFSGEKDFADATARVASASDAVHLDAVVLTAECIQAKVDKMEDLVLHKLDSITERIQAAQEQSAECARQIQDKVSLSQNCLSSLIQNMQHDLMKDPRQHPGVAVVRMEEPPETSEQTHLLDTYIKSHGAVPLSRERSQHFPENFSKLPEHLIMPLLLAVLACLTTRQRLESMLRDFITLTKNDPASAALIACLLIAFSRITFRLSLPLSILGADHVIFEDAFGSSWRLPFTTCQHQSGSAGDGADLE